MNSDAAQLSDIGIYFGNILSAMMPLLGFLAFGALLFGGFQVLTAGADTKAAGAGKSTMTAAAIGIVFALGAWLVLTIIEKLTGAPVTQFRLSFD